MSKISILRTNMELPANMDSARDFLFGAIDGFSKDDKRSWRRFWKRVAAMEPGEMAQAEFVFPRSGPFHRRHMKIEQSVFDAQDRFVNFEQFRNWIKLGAGYCDWVPGAKGGIVPLPKSISYAKADDEEFKRYHGQVMAFLHGPHAAPYLWRHLGDGAHEMMESILEAFDE